MCCQVSTTKIFSFTFFSSPTEVLQLSLSKRNLTYINTKHGPVACIILFPLRYRLLDFEGFVEFLIIIKSNIKPLIYKHYKHFVSVLLSKSVKIMKLVIRCHVLNCP